MMGIEKPLPNPSEDSEPYWEATLAGALKVPKCTECSHWFLPPANICPQCLSESVELEKVSGRATVFSWIVVHRPQHPGFFADAPYNVAIVELEEGPRMHTRLVGIEPDDVEIGMQLQVEFEKVEDEIVLPIFRPVTGK